MDLHTEYHRPLPTPLTSSQKVLWENSCTRPISRDDAVSCSGDRHPDKETRGSRRQRHEVYNLRCNALSQ
eukprot:5183437-Prorocentrum_lima.AAC.1